MLMSIATEKRKLSFHPPQPMSYSGFCISLLQLCLRDLCSDTSISKTTVTSDNTDFHNYNIIDYSHQQSGEGNGTPLQYSCLENHMDRGARWAAVHGIAKSQTRLSDFTFTFHFHWRRKWQLTPVFLPGESQGRGSLVGCRLWGRTESDTTEVT